MEYIRKHFLINFTQCNVMLIFGDFQHIFFFSEWCVDFVLYTIHLDDVYDNEHGLFFDS